MKRIFAVFRIPIFILVLVLLLYGVSSILEKPVHSSWDASGLAKSRKNPNYYDVIFVGTSIVVMNVSNEELYENYGIAGLTLGIPEQPTYLSYFSLVDALDHQTPKVCFFDINSLFYSEKTIREKVEDNEYYHLHLSMDSMKNLQNKYQAFQVAKKLNPELDFWNYFVPLYNNHVNWEDITKGNFVRESSDKVINGNLMDFTIAEGIDELREKQDTDYGDEVDEYAIPKINKDYLLRMIQLCKDRSISLVLLRGGGVHTFLTEGEYNAVQQIAEENQIPFLDLSQCEEEVGFDWRFDTVDGNHHNIMGAKKWTDYLGNYLVSHYQFEDRRMDSRYDSFMEQSERYQNALSTMQTKIDLLSAVNFDQYLDELLKIGTNENTIFITVYDEATNNLTSDEYDKLRQLGLQKNLHDKFRYSYVALLDNGDIADRLSVGTVSLSGKLDSGEEYTLTSGGFWSGSSASIKIDETEVAQGRRGFNIVVYNKEFQMILSNVYFDTYAIENPSTTRVKSVLQSQFEADENVWLPVE